MRYSIDMDGLALNFVHKRLLGAAGAFITSGGNPLAAAGGFAAGGAKTRAQTIKSGIVARERGIGGALGCPPNFDFVVGTGCVPRPGHASLVRTCFPPFRPDPVTGQCKIFIGDRPGPDSAPLPIGAGTGGGAAVMGRYGAALVPGSRIIDRAVCLKGMQLGDDGLCYNKGQISNKQRAWPKGRAPLLTGGQMRAISIAATAGRRLERTTKRLQKIGLMKKPAPRRVKSGPTDHHHHS